MSTHNGYVKEFPFIRIDRFSSIPNPTNGKYPLYHFLTHAHTDHFVGLNSPHFNGQIYTTKVTRHLLQHTMEASERVRFEEFRERVKRPKKKFENLFRNRSFHHHHHKDNLSSTLKRGERIEVVTGGGEKEVLLGKNRKREVRTSLDQIKEIRLNEPIKLKGPNEGDEVTVIAIDANHCPGSCMFLFEGVYEGTFRSIIVTGDIRAEPWWIDSLRHNPILSNYVVSSNGKDKDKGKGKEGTMDNERQGMMRRPVRELDCIYLDTSNVMLDEELVEKEEAIRQVIEMMDRYPDDTRFFLNCWTWGYEELLKGVYRHFREPIHLDWYKHKIFTTPSTFDEYDPLLAKLGRIDPYLGGEDEGEDVDINFPSPSLHAPPPSSRLDDPHNDNNLDKSTTKTNPQLELPKKALRFHACERFWKCDHVWKDGIGCYTWDEEFLTMRDEYIMEREDLESRGRGKNAGRKRSRSGGGDEDSKEEMIRRLEKRGIEEGAGAGGMLKQRSTDREKGKEGFANTRKKLMRPGSGEYLTSDGRVAVRGTDIDEEEDSEPMIVYVNPAEIPKWKWEEYRRGVDEQIKRAEAGSSKDRDRAQRKEQFPTNLLVPLARHSTLPELQAFVSIFRPQTLYPLTIVSSPHSPARDYLSMSSLFSKVLAPGGEERLRREAKEYVKALKRNRGKQTLTSSPEDAVVEEEELYGEGERERALRAKGLNVEGGQEVIDNFLRWTVGLEREPVNSNPPPPNGGIHFAFDEPPATSFRDVEVNRQLSFGEGSSSSRSPSRSGVVATSSLLPSAFPPPSSTQPQSLEYPSATPPIARTIPSTTSTRTLRKSVTFAASPTKSPSQVDERHSTPSLAGSTPSPRRPFKRSRSLPSSPSVPIAIVADLSPRILSSSSNRSPSQPFRSSSENVPTPSFLNNPSAQPQPHQPLAQQQQPRTNVETTLEKKRLILSLQRTLQGRIGPGKKQIIPFTAREREVLKSRERKLRAEIKVVKGKQVEVEVERERRLSSPVGFEEVGSSY